MKDDVLKPTRSLVEVLAENRSAVNHPPHYNTGRIEVIDAIEDWRLGFCLGNAVKYIALAAHKGRELEDLKKAAWYLNREIERISREADAL